MSEHLLTWDADGVRQWAEATQGRPAVLVHSLRGFIDAGRAGALVSGHLLGRSEPRRIATFAIDELLDYRSRRPEMTFSVNQWTSYDEPSLVVDMVHDAAGTPFLLLHGFEPDIRWEAFIRSVRTMVDKLGVTLVAGAHGIPMAAPHTRELLATVHGTSPELLPDEPTFFGTVQVPASAHNLLEYRFGQWGLSAINVAVHVPHYLAQSSYPQAAQRALESLQERTGLELEPELLDEDARTAAEEIQRQLDESDEVQALVAALEEQYDEFVASRAEGITIDGPLPTAEELAAEFEHFLAQQRRDLPPQP